MGDESTPVKVLLPPRPEEPPPPQTAAITPNNVPSALPPPPTVTPNATEIRRKSGRPDPDGENPQVAKTSRATPPRQCSGGSKKGHRRHGSKAASRDLQLQKVMKPLTEKCIPDRDPKIVRDSKYKAPPRLGIG